MDGVDIAGYQDGINTRALTADFVIIKATEGLQGTVYNPDYRRMADDAEASGKLIGFYHYANGQDPVAEADCFYNAIKDYKGRAVACLDWELQGNPLFGSGQDTAWCRKFLDRIRERFGGTPLIYTSKGVCMQWDWAYTAQDYPLWGAEYAYADKVYQGYQADPWQSSRQWGAWGRDVSIHQYGYVNPKPNNGGYKQLDADKAYVTREQWLAWCGQGAPARKVIHVSAAERAALIHYDMVTDDRNGYSQAPVRWGGDHPDGKKRVELVGGAVEYDLGSYDCSSSDIKAWQLALVGTPFEGALDAATCTSDMREVFLASGLFYADRTPAKRGDVYLNDGHHTAMCQDGGMGDGPFGYDCLSHFRGNEWGGFYDGEVGDQTGNEARIQPFYEAWATTLHYNGKADYDIYEDDAPKPVQVPGDAVNDLGVRYCAHCRDIDWQEPVHDGQVAGTTGFSCRAEAFRIWFPKGVDADVIVHVKDLGSLFYEHVTGEMVLGTTGQSRRAEAIRIHVRKLPKALKGKTIHLQAHVKDLGWLDVVGDDQWAGTLGESRRLEAIRMWFE